MQHLGSFLVYEPVIRELAARGHRLHLAVSRTESLGWEHALEKVLAENPQITWGWLSPSPSTSAFWFELAETTRLWADYLRYFELHYASAPKLLARAEERVPPRLVRISQRPLFQTPKNRQRLLNVLRTLERALPPVREIQQQLKDYRPDVVVVTPLVYLGSWQFEVLRAALAEGLRTAFAVGSWDHVSRKALIRDLPQRIFVWNETQKEEAVRLHRVPADRVVVTGAQCYDQWFGRVPLRTREEFCRHVGLSADRPFILYVCSALFWGSPVEAEFVRRWVQSLRASAAPELSGAGILVRPHPARTAEWPSIDLSSCGGVALHGSNPMDADSKEDYFESLFYSHAVVGLNTSAFLEAAVVGRPLHTILVSEFSENQEGTLHFHYLRNVGGGVLQTSRSFEEHHEQLVVSLRDPACRAAANRQFVREFIRPHGLDVPATPAFCDALDDLLQATVPHPERTSARLVLLRWLAYPMFLVLRRVYGAELFRDDWKRNDPEHQRRLELRDRERQTRQQAAEDAKRLREQRRAEKAAVREAAVRAARAERAAGEAEKARRLQAGVREKGARARQRGGQRCALVSGRVRKCGSTGGGRAGKGSGHERAQSRGPARCATDGCVASRSAGEGRHVRPRAAKSARRAAPAASRTERGAPDVRQRRLGVRGGASAGAC